MSSKPIHHYFSVDPSNVAEAQERAARRGLRLEQADSRDLKRLQREQANLIVDWDYTDDDLRRQLLKGWAPRVIAVHGYQIPDSVASFLPRRGVVVSRHLDDQFFMALVGIASAA